MNGISKDDRIDMLASRMADHMVRFGKDYVYSLLRDRDGISESQWHCIHLAQFLYYIKWISHKELIKELK